MMDAYQGYYQIPLTKEDQDKVNFFMVEGTFTMMLFSLKNAIVTYQWLIYKVFMEKIRQNVETYVDDILVKSLLPNSLVSDLMEIFATIQRFDMKLNPEKCIFRVRQGWFLGYIVNEWGIEVNSKKIEAI